MNYQREYAELPANERLSANNQEEAFKLLKIFPMHEKHFYFDDFDKFKSWLIKTFDQEEYSVSQFHSATSFKDLILRLLKSKKTDCYFYKRFGQEAYLGEVKYDLKKEYPKFDSLNNAPFGYGEHYRFSKLSSLRECDLTQRGIISFYNIHNLAFYNDEGEMWIMTSCLY